ncbi:unnamed protein product [Rhizoctonia solani]|uniref:F-box domain-containing protein n=1 Tax=Rhizoctonia solani TaxID=456999 RepID=A0A8H3DW69_9AGAM|nr:unnamed protein product [Rhizoctonia solani]
MARTRSSARLAEAKGKEARIKSEEVDDPMLLDEPSVKTRSKGKGKLKAEVELEAKSESEYDQSEDEERPPPRKRQRTSIRPVKTQVWKKQVRGKQGGLAVLVDMPIDIFTEIASHLLPIDIVSLSRSSKFFRSFLMDRSSIHIWHTAMRNIRGLPPCPPDLSEPHYLSLLFSKFCTMCCQPVRSRMDEILRVRFCTSCRDKHLVSLDTIAWDLRCLVHHSSKIMPSKARWGPSMAHVLKEEAREVEQKYQEMKNGGDKTAMEEWEKETKAAIQKRIEESTPIQFFLDIIESDREHEVREIKNARRREIEDRFVKLGWDKKDMQFTYNFPSRREWYSLVEKAQPLTERIWSNLQPKLIPILEANREERLQKEKSDRQSARRIRLAHLMREIKKTQAPLLDITVRSPTVPQKSSHSGKSGDDSQEAGPSSRVVEAQSSDAIPLEVSSDDSDISILSDITFHDIFPDIEDALQWPMVQELYETDTSVSKMEQNFIAGRAEIDAAIADWKTNTHTRLAEMLRRDQDVQSQPLTPRLIVQENKTDPFANFSDDLKLLLRADSLFIGVVTRTRKIIHSYELATTQFGYGIAFRDGIMSKPYKPPLNFGRIRAYDEARPVIRVLLAHMGLENACIAELQSVGRGYVCGRCHDTKPKTWEDLVLHYMEAKEVFTRVQEHTAKLEALDVTYRDVHDPDAFSDRPLVKFTSPLSGNITRACTLCTKEPISHVVRGPEERIIEHLKDVHNIAAPQLGTHYSSPHFNYPAIFDLDSGSEFDLDPGIFFPFDDSDLEGPDFLWNSF